MRLRSSQLRVAPGDNVGARLSVRRPASDQPIITTATATMSPPPMVASRCHAPLCPAVMVATAAMNSGNREVLSKLLSSRRMMPNSA